MKVEFKAEDEDDEGRPIGPVWVDGKRFHGKHWFTKREARDIAKSHRTQLVEG